jgi:hypothetical protein
MKKTLELAKPTLLIAAVLLVGAALPSALLAQGLPSSSSLYSTLIDIDFGAHLSPGLNANKLGLAAAGLTVTDFWNFYSRDDGQGHWQIDGALPNLRFTDGSTSSAGLIVSNAPACWADGSSDAMYNTYVYPFDGGNTTVTVTNLAAGQYDLYVCGPNGTYQLVVGSTSFGSRSSFDWPVINPTVWQEGRQYAVFRGVPVIAAQTVTLTALPNACGSLGISGMQIGSATVVTGTPPSIVAQPQNHTAVAGSSATFAVAAGGTPPLRYQWQLNSAAITGATASTLTLTNVRTRQAGSYRAVVTNAFGSVTSSNAVLTVIPTQPCDAPPEGLVSWWRAEGDASDYAGTNNGILQGGVTFTPGRVGQAFGFNGTNSYVQVPSRSGLKPTGSFTVEAWVNYDTLFGANGGTIVAKGQDAEDVIDWALVMGPTQQLRPHLNVGVYWNVYNCASTLDTGVWYHVAMVYDGASLRGYVNGALDGTTAASGTVQATDYPLRIGAYAPVNGTASKAYLPGRIDELSLYNRALSASNVAAIYNAGSAGKCGLPPSIATQPQSQTVGVGSSVTLRVAATGTGPLSYQWRLGGTNLAGATGSALLLANVKPANAGSYSVRVTNTFGAITSSNAILTVASVSPCAPPPSGLVSWWRAESSASDSVGSNNGALLNGASFAAGMVGQAFSLNGSNQCVQVPLSPSLVASNYSIEAWVKPLAQVSDFINQDLIFGQNFGQCQMLVRTGSIGVDVAFAFGTSHYTFFEVAGTSQIPIGQFSHLAGTWDGTTLRLYINGVLNAQSTPGALPVNSGCPFFIGGFYSPAADSCNYVGQFFNGLIDEVSDYKRALSAAEIQAIYLADGAGKCAVGTAPTITAQPASQTVQAGSSVTFAVTATGTSLLSYQWRFSGTDIAGATGASLRLSNVQPVQAGVYAVQMGNAYGSATSSNAVLTVNPAASCAPPPSGLVSWWRGEGDGLDAVGTNSGTLQNGATFGVGRVAQSFALDGVNEYVKIPKAASLDAPNQLTIDF